MSQVSPFWRLEAALSQVFKDNIPSPLIYAFKNFNFYSLSEVPETKNYLGK
jgi:hypothetical protein